MKNLGENQIMWKSIWEKKGANAPENIGLPELIAMDGFDSGASRMSTGSWLSFVKHVMGKLNINKIDKVLEIGCGAGAFLFPIYSANIKVFGIDYSKSLVQICQQAMPGGVFHVAEANRLPFGDAGFDVIISNSVFHYFDGLRYAEYSIREMSRVLKSKGRMALLDINDASRKQEYESFRMASLGRKRYELLYGELTHQFYEKEWFRSIADSLGLECEIENQSIEGYDNSGFRYNVYLR